MQAANRTARPSALEGLAHLPVGVFATVMGMAGLTLATERMAHGLPALAPLAFVSMFLTALLFLALIGVYGLKFVHHREAVLAEWRHPVRLAFFPAITIGLLLVATALAPRVPAVAEPLWLAGALAHLVLMLAVVKAWIEMQHFEPPHLNPAWFIPAVGNVLVPIAGVPFGWVELSWFFFGVGLLFWLVLLTLVFNRLIFHQPLPARLSPTFCILIAPPAVAFLAWVRLAGEVGAFGRVLFAGAVLFFLLLLVQAPKLLRLPWALSFWAYSFPLAAFTLATSLAAERLAQPLLSVASWVLYALLVLVIGALAVRTVRGALAGELFRPEG
ncbi:MAG: SLAC1 anion channel family protein [Geminicoccaceae bacterium]|nr:SLAC1 anion channel family protein [Geminicoccaceae bacterium]